MSVWDAATQSVPKLPKLYMQDVSQVLFVTKHNVIMIVKKKIKNAPFILQYI